jgi:hypothetical protein
MSMLKDIKEDYGNEPKDISQTEFQEMLSSIKTQSDEIQNERTITEEDMTNIVTSMITSSGVGDFDEEETRMFYELFKHILERMSNGYD